MVFKELGLSLIGSDGKKSEIKITVIANKDSNGYMKNETPKIFLHSDSRVTEIDPATMMGKVRGNKLAGISLSVRDKEGGMVLPFDMFNSVLVNFSRWEVEQTAKLLKGLSTSDKFTLNIDMIINPKDLIDQQMGLGVSLAKILSRFGIEPNQIVIKDDANDGTTQTVLKYLLDYHIRWMSEKNPLPSD